MVFCVNHLYAVETLPLHSAKQMTRRLYVFVFLFEVISYYKLMPKGSFVSEFLALRIVIL